MPAGDTLLLFAAAAMALIVVPGPAVLYIVAQSIDRGRLAGVVSALGVAVGGLVHVTAATIGLSSLLVSSATAFSVVKYAGAAYLIALGVYTLVRPRRVEPPVARPQRMLSRRFLQGVVVNVLNPKTALFFLAFLPQFVDPARGNAVMQTVLLGLLFNTSGTIVNVLVALGASRAGSWLRRGRAGQTLQRATGVIFVALGLRLALAGRR